MRRYETIIIIDPDAKEDDRSGFIERISELIPQHGGFVVELDDWGQRRMAYEVKKKIRGHYTRFDFCGDGTLVDEMERTFRIDDRVMKYMTVLLEKYADVEAIKEAIEIKKAKTEPEKSSQAEVQQATSEEADSSEEVKVTADNDTTEPEKS
jgi:small subunit ribosomal protein S6